MTTRNRAQLLTPTDLTPRRLQKTFGSDILVVCRESSMRRDLLDQMLRQTLRNYRGDPRAVRALELGLRPLDNPELVQGTRIGSKGTKGVVYDLDGFVVLIYAGSAFKKDRAGDVTLPGESDNAYAQAVADVVRVYRPHHIHCNDTSRLIRCLQHFSPAQDVIAAVKSSISLGDSQVSLNTPEGRETMRQQGSAAEGERDRGQLKMMSGKMWKAVDRVWPIARHFLPEGYTLGVGRVVEIDETQRALVRSIIKLLGDYSSPKDFVEGLAELGIRSVGLMTRAGYQADPGQAPLINAVKNKLEVVERYVRRLSCWKSGVYPIQHGNTLPYADEISGFDVFGDDGGPGFLHQNLLLGVPEGGWASDAEFDRAFARASQSHRRGGNRRESGEAIVSGMPGWFVGDRERWIRRMANRFVLLERKASEEEIALGAAKFGSRVDPAKHLVTVAPQELLDAIVDTTLDALRSSVQVERLDGVAGADDYEMAYRQQAAHARGFERNRLRDLGREIEKVRTYAMEHQPGSPIRRDESAGLLHQVRVGVGT